MGENVSSFILLSLLKGVELNLAVTRQEAGYTLDRGSHIDHSHSLLWTI